MRKFTVNRWNWSEKAAKWVYVSKKEGRRIYQYQIKPPKEFIDLTIEINKLNEKLLNVGTDRENENIYTQMMDLSKKLQELGR